MNNNLLILVLFLFTLLSSCEKEVTGCMSPFAENFNPYATNNCCCKLNQSAIVNGIVGTYTVASDDCTSTEDYEVEIVLHDYFDNSVRMYNWLNFGKTFSTNAFVLEDGSILIGSLAFQVSEGDTCYFELNGSMELNGQDLYFFSDFTIQDQSCSPNWTDLYCSGPMTPL